MDPIAPTGAAKLLANRRLCRIFPFLSWTCVPRGVADWRADAIAGLTVALVLVPQSMAYAQLAGLPAHYGLYAAFLPPIVGALFGSSRQLATGPVAVVSLLTAAALEPIAVAGSDGYVVYAIVLSLFVGLFQLTLGLLRLGVMVNFLSHPVIIGFTNAAAIIIATSQLDKIFGVRADKAPHQLQTVWNAIVAIPAQIHWPTFAMGAGALVLMLLLRRVNSRLPAVLIAATVTTVLSWALQFERLLTVPLANLDSEVARAIESKQAPLLEAKQQVLLAEQKYLGLLADYGAKEDVTEDARRAFDSLRYQYEREQRALKADTERLRQTHFVRVATDTDAASRFYLEGRVPADATHDGRIWRVQSVRNGMLVMNGGGRVVGEIPLGLPEFKLPTFDLNVLSQLIVAAITISLIGFLEAISMAKAMAAKTRQRVDANQELVGQGLANVVGSVFQSYPVSGSFSRSAVNLSAGALSGFASITTGLVVMATLLWLTPLFYHLPQATLAAVILMAVTGLVNLKGIKHAWQTNRSDGVVAVTTFVLTLIFAPHLDMGILIGAGTALVLYLYRTMQPRVAVLARHPDGTLRDAAVFGLETCDEIAVVRFDGSLYFANTAHFEDRILEQVATRPKLKYIIVPGDGINQLDFTGAETLEHLIERLKLINIEILFTGLKKQVREVFARSGLERQLGPQAFFRTDAQALAYVWQRLGHDHAAHCPLNIVRALADASQSQVKV